MKKTGIIAAAGLAALISFFVLSSAPKADMKTDVDSLSYSIGIGADPRTEALSGKPPRRGHHLSG